MYAAIWNGKLKGAKDKLLYERGSIMETGSRGSPLDTSGRQVHLLICMRSVNKLGHYMNTILILYKKYIFLASK